MRSRTSILLILITLLATSGCHKKKGFEAFLRLAFAFNYGGTPFNLGDTYQDDFGNVIQFDKLRFYVSGARSYDAQFGLVGDHTDRYMLVDAANAVNNFELGGLDADNVFLLEYTLGLDNVTNHADPTTAAAPLNDPTMHWGWNPAAGYKFLVVEGQVDTDNDGTVDTPFVYHCATDPLKRLTGAQIDMDVPQSTTGLITLNVDVSEIIDNVPVNVELDTHTNNNLPLAEQLMDNLAFQAITY